jgi:hypothetical protein
MAMVAAQNHLHPLLDVKVHEVSRSDTESFRQAILDTARGAQWRAILNLERIQGTGTPSHGVAVEVSRSRGGKVSVIAIDSAWGCYDAPGILPAAMQGMKNAKLAIINTGTQKDVVNCKIFALSNAKLMADARDMMKDLHQRNLNGKIGGFTDDSRDGVAFTVVGGADVLDARFFRHTTSPDTFNSLPEHMQEELGEVFTANLKAIDASGTRRVYNNSIEQERIRYLRDALALCPGRPNDGSMSAS